MRARVFRSDSRVPTLRVPCPHTVPALTRAQGATRRTRYSSECSPRYRPAPHAATPRRPSLPGCHRFFPPAWAPRRPGRTSLCPACRIRSAAHVRRSRAARRKYPRRPSSALRGRPFRARTPRRTGPRPAPGRRWRHRRCAHSGFQASPCQRVWIFRRGTRNTSHNAVTLPDLRGRSTYQATSSVPGLLRDSAHLRQARSCRAECLAGYLGHLGALVLVTATGTSCPFMSDRESP